jgi:hypothetical protein
MLKSFASLMLALVVAITAWLGGIAGSMAVMLPGGTADDTALREAALYHNIDGVRAALTKRADPNAPSNTAKRITPLDAAVSGS